MNVDGTVGDTLIANGAINTTFDVTTNTLRVRLVNGSNARDLDFSLSSGEPFTQIATDVGLLDPPVSLETLTLTPSERSEIIIDFSDLSHGDNLALQADGIPFTTFTVHDHIEQDGDWTDVFTEAPVANESTNRIDINVRQGSTKVWEIYNREDMMGGMTHPFHDHDVQFSDSRSRRQASS